MADWLVEEVEDSCPLPFHSIGSPHPRHHLWRVFLACVPYKLQGQPQWNFAPFIFYSVVAACLRYVCTWTEEVLFLCANGIELLIKWVSWIHKANQSERQREVRICSLALQQLLRLIWQIQLLFVCCTNSSSVSSFCVSVCSVWWRLGIHSKNNHNKPIDGQDEWGKPTEERQIFFYFIFVIDFEKTSQFFYNTRYRK